MLRSVRLKNFVHFKNETIEIETDSRAVFFMGENNSGKSCVFEAIRRCMSTSKSLSMSNPHEADKDMFVTCHFSNENKQVYSSVIRPADSPNRKPCDEHVVKIVYVNFEDRSNSCFAMDIVKETKTRLIVNQALSETLTSELEEQYKHSPIDDFVQTVLQNTNVWGEIQQFVKPESNAAAYRQETKCETYLKKHVDETTVITFPMRSISPYQWTESHRLQHQQTPDNIKDVSERAEILSWYLKTESDVTDKEKEREKRYFETLTNMCSFEFQIDEENNIIALNGNFKDGVKKAIYILKVPEGIYEAKKISIILALERFKTICFEDPDRGMHTQMVERFRDLVLHGIGDKTIVVTSHQPTFLSPWTIPHTFHFRRHKQRDEQTFKVVALRSISTDGPPGGEKMARIISSRDLPTIFLARQLLFGEGDDDFLFMKALQQILLTSDIAEKCSEQCNTTVEKLRSAICPLHIVPMTGEANKLKFRYICKKLGISHLFMIDNDALYNNIKRPTRQSHTSEYKIYPFLCEYEIPKLDDKEFCQAVEDDVSALEESGFFVWKKSEQCSGKIDSVVIQFCATEGLIEFMRKNNVNPFKKTKDSDIPKNDNEIAAYIAKQMVKKKNIFTDHDLSSQNITDAVTKLVEQSLVSKNTDNEILRFLKFLSKACDGQNSGP